MRLQVTGSRLGCTGTMSLELAPEQFGLGLWHHMKALLDRAFVKIPVPERPFRLTNTRKECAAHTAVRNAARRSKS